MLFSAHIEQPTGVKLKYLNDMMLGFKKQFMTLILSGIKIHTIREDKANRWKLGMMIQCATGVRTKAYKQFSQEQCVSVQKIKIKWQTENLLPFISVDENTLTISEMIGLARNDGFASFHDFCEWFSKDFEGKIIHWTDFRY